MANIIDDFFELVRECRESWVETKTLIQKLPVD